MAKTSTLTVTASVTGDGLAGDSYAPPQGPFVNTSAPQGIPSVVQLGGGSNSLAVPAGAQYALLVPPAASTNAKLAKTISGDTGVSFTSSIVLLPVAGLSTIYCTATAGEALSIAWL
jgi:hypothetical protein